VVGRWRLDSAAHVWVAGRWRLDGAAHVWVAGRWRCPRVGGGPWGTCARSHAEGGRRAWQDPEWWGL